MNSKIFMQLQIFIANNETIGISFYKLFHYLFCLLSAFLLAHDYFVKFLFIDDADPYGNFFPVRSLQVLG